MARTTCEAYLSLFRPGHPLRAISLAQLGQMLAVDFDPRELENPGDNVIGSKANETPNLDAPAKLLAQASQVLRQAVTELTYAFGRMQSTEEDDGGEVGRESRDQLLKVDRELDIWKRGVRNVLNDMGGF